MSPEKREFALGTYLLVSYPWGVNHAGAAMCPDGIVRRLARIAQTADTFFSTPAAVRVRGKYVHGYVTVETAEGWSTATDKDPGVLKFCPHTTGKNTLAAFNGLPRWRAPDKFARAYVECALWSSTDNSTPSGGEPLDKNYSMADIAPVALARMVADCQQFQNDACGPLLVSGQSDEQSGHDFWLTRNGHGVGFWDRGLPEDIDRTLTDLAHAAGPQDLYVGEDGRLYV